MIVAISKALLTMSASKALDPGGRERALPALDLREVGEFDGVDSTEEVDPRLTIGAPDRQSSWKRYGNNRVQPGENAGMPNLPETA